jgi:hypothetical protein
VTEESQVYLEKQVTYEPVVGTTATPVSLIMEQLYKTKTCNRITSKKTHIMQINIEHTQYSRPKKAKKNAK